LLSRYKIAKITQESTGVGGKYPMKAILGTIHNGQIVPDQPVEWPEGCRVVIEPAAKVETLGLRDEDWPTTPEGIARLLALMEDIEPLEMTPEEEAAWQADRKARKEWEKASFEKTVRKLEDLFE
jgi:hypothetical protein